jgi:hypothetical protein
VLKDNAFNKCAVVIVVVVVVVVYEMFFVFVFYSVRIVELNTPSLKCKLFFIQSEFVFYSVRIVFFFGPGPGRQGVVVGRGHLGVDLEPRAARGGRWTQNVDSRNCTLALAHRGPLDYSMESLVIILEFGKNCQNKVSSISY